jgi:hypothetical protein
VIAVGLPLAAWWLGGRRFWGRLRPGQVKDPVGHLMREHGLAGAEAAQVMTAVGKGERLDDPRMRRAAVDLAKLRLEAFRNPLMDTPRRRRIVTGSFVVLLAGLVVLIGLDVAEGDFDFPFGLVGVVAVLFSMHRQRRMLERAIVENSGAPVRE